MPTRLTPPGAYTEEIATVEPIAGVETSVAAFVGHCGGEGGEGPVAIHGMPEFTAAFDEAARETATGRAVEAFFANGGGKALVLGLPDGGPLRPSALDPLEDSSFNLLCVPPEPGVDHEVDVHRAAMRLCEHKRAIYIVDPAWSWFEKPDPVKAALEGAAGWPASRNAALYFPLLLPATGGRTPMMPSGAVAGVIARTDASRGIWKAPAGLDATLSGVTGVSHRLTDQQNGLLNPNAVNCLRIFSGQGPVVWGARTRAGQDSRGDERKYLPVQRMAMFIEASLEEGTRWAVFEKNGDRLWSRLRAQISHFLEELFRQGAFTAQTPRDAYFVTCDEATMTQADIDAGRLLIRVGFAPLKPAEFVVLSIRQNLARDGNDG